MKLFTIGDSVSQGFMSLAAARTDNAYSTLIAKQLGLQLNSDEYHFADWNDTGIPLNIEVIMRELQSRYGTNIGGLEWLTVGQTINRIVDRAEDYYERGDGREDVPYDKIGTRFFNNAAVWGFDVADSFQVTAKTCKTAILLSQKEKPTGDNLFSLGADNPMYRTALKILNPSLDPAFDDFSQLSWLNLHATGKGDNGKNVTDQNGNQVKGAGVENLILWLGANNALGTVLKLKINQTPNRKDMRPHTIDHLLRAKAKWNLWHPEDFAADYRVMIDRVDAIMRQNLEPNWKVFIGTVPLVTIAPIAKGIGETTEVPIVKKVDGKKIVTGGVYYKNYTYFPFEEDFAIETGKYLTMQDALHIDNCIREYNRIIKDEVDRLNKAHGKIERYFVVDTCQMLEDLAYKRNNGHPPYELPEELQFIYPPVNTKYYYADTEGRLKQGGLFSLDGVHPTSIGHGIIAFEFLKRMGDVGVKNAGGNPVSRDLDWRGEKGILQSDLLYSQPIRIMQEIYGKGAVASLASRVIDFITSVSQK